MNEIYLGTPVAVLRIGMEVEYATGRVWCNLDIDPALGAYVVIPGHRLVFEIDPNGNARVYRERVT